MSVDEEYLLAPSPTHWSCKSAKQSVQSNRKIGPRCAPAKISTRLIDMEPIFVTKEEI